MYYYYATRDVEAGKELLVNYLEFEEKSQVGWVEEFSVGAIIQD
jgi:SET domain-containing protein